MKRSSWFDTVHRLRAAQAVVALLAVTGVACGTDSGVKTGTVDTAVQADAPDTQADGTDPGDTTADTTGSDDAGVDTIGADLGSDAAPLDVADGGDSGDTSPVDVPKTDVPKGDTATGKDDFQELLVKVLGPSGRDWVQNEGQKIQLSGVAFGGADSITWTLSPSGKTGEIKPPATYWVSGILELDKGDNQVVVTATKGTQTATDTVHITYNPFFSFDGAPDMSPNLAFVGQSTTVVVRMSMPAATPGADGKSIVDPSSITFIEVDSMGKAVSGGTTAKLQDSGQGGNCDDVQKDAVYSACVNFVPSTAKTMYFRVKANVDVFGTKYEALSPVTVLDVVQKFDKTECKSIVSLQKKVKADYLGALAGSGPAAAQQAAIAALQADTSVAEAGSASGGFGVWVRYKSGRLGALNLAPAGTRAGGGAPDGGTTSAALPTYSVGTRRALALAPFNSEFKTDGAGDEAEEAGLALKDKQCPPFAVDLATGNDAYLKYYREMSSYGIVTLTGHGDVYFEGMDTAAKQALNWEHLGAQEVIWSGEKVDCDAMANGSSSCNKQGSGCAAGQTCVKTSVDGGTCVDLTQGDVMTGRAIIGDDVYGFTPSFIQRHAVDLFPASIIYLGACRSMYNGSMAVELFGNGAAAVLGFSGYVSNKFAYQQGHALVDGLVNGGLSTLQAMSAAEDPDHPGSRMRLIGNGKSNVKDDSLINPSWDLGKLTGWKPVGDGRVISRLGATIPVAGKYMGIISTGLGFTTQNGSLEQPFCIPASKTQLCYYWKFYSEEFIEYCGSSYMDRFTSTLQADTGKLTMTDVYIDLLCPYDCGGKSPCDQSIPGQCKCGGQWKTLSKADVSFDIGDVWMTPWQKTCTDVTPLAGSGKKATLKFYATDTGDSVFDTVVLLDEVTVE
jgi:hypothetical protein